MKFGLLTAILEGTTFEEAVDFAAENQLECLEVACWPNTGGAKRRYAGVCHIDAEALTEEKAKEIIQYCKERNSDLSHLKAWLPPEFSFDVWYPPFSPGTLLLPSMQQ